MVTAFFAMTALASASTNDSVDQDHINQLPSPDSPTLYCTLMNPITYAPARVLLAELLEQRGQHDAAIQWARTDLEVHGSVDPLRSNSSTEPLVFPLPLACHRTQ